MTYAMAGQREKAVAMRRELLLRREAGEYITPISFLAVDLGLGNVENMRADLLEYLDEGGNGWGQGIVTGPLIRKFVTHPAIADLLERLEWFGLPKPS
jgi:hypothetical protein